MKALSTRLLFFLLGLVVILLVLLVSLQMYLPKMITLGLVAELTGGIQLVGKSSLQGANLAIQDVNKAGGVVVKGRHYTFKLLVEDNKANIDVTKKVTQELVNKGAMAMVGPNASRYAIPAATIAENDKTLLISPWSTNPQTTLLPNGEAKQYVFRAAFLDNFQGNVLAHFAKSSISAKTAAIMYEQTSSVSAEQAAFFKKTFEQLGGKVVDEESFKNTDTTFTQQLNKVNASHPDVIFLPAYYAEAAAIMKQAKQLTIKAPFLGSDAWGSQEVITACGADCNGYYMTAHFSPQSTDPKTIKFVQEYTKVYGETPDDVAALTYDSFGLIFQAIKNTQGKIDRQSIATAMSTITHFQGVTGEMNFAPHNGNPTKSAVILQIKNGKLVWFANVQPSL